MNIRTDISMPCRTLLDTAVGLAAVRPGGVPGGGERGEDRLGEDIILSGETSRY